MMMMMMIITVPKSYVVSGLPLWCNKDDFTLTEPATCFRPVHGFLQPDSRPPDTASSFPAISRVPTAWLWSTGHSSFVSGHFPGSYRLARIHQARLLCFCSVPWFLLPDDGSSTTTVLFLLLCFTAWIAPITFLLFPFSFWIFNSWMASISCTCLVYFFPAFLLPGLCPYFSLASIRFLPNYLVAFVRNLLVCRISIQFLRSYNLAHVLHLRNSSFSCTICSLTATILHPSLLFPRSYRLARLSLARH